MAVTIGSSPSPIQADLRELAPECGDVPQLERALDAARGEGVGFTLGGGTLILNVASTASVHAIASNSTLTSGALQMSGTGGDQISDSAVLTVIDLATLGGGGMFLCSQFSGSYGATTLGAEGGTIKFDTGTFTATSLQLGSKTTSSTNTASGKFPERHAPERHADQ